MTPPAFTLPPSDPRLCPGTGQECCINEPYRRIYCPHCGGLTGADNAPGVPGGGRVAAHYPAGPPRRPRPAPGVRIPAVPPAPPASTVGQLDLFREETARG